MHSSTAQRGHSSTGSGLGSKTADREACNGCSTCRSHFLRCAVVWQTTYPYTAVTGKTWGSQDISFENFLLGGYFAAEKADLAQDALAAEMVTA